MRPSEQALAGISSRVAARWAMVSRVAASSVPIEPVQYPWERGRDTVGPEAVGFSTVREGPGQKEPSTKVHPGEDPGEGSIYDIAFAEDMLKHQDNGPVDVTDWSGLQLNYPTPNIPQDVRR